MLTQTLLRLLAACVLGVATLTVAMPARAAGSVVAPDIGPPGTTFRFKASGFTPNEIVRAATVRPDGQRIRYADAMGLDIPLYADAAGDVTWSYTPPARSPDGVYIAEAANVSGQLVRRIGFIVQAGSIAQDLNVDRSDDGVYVRPTLGPPGSLYVFRAAGFQAEERVALWVHSPDGLPADLSTDIGGQREYRADRSGAIEWVAGTRSTTTGGRYVAVAVGVSSSITRVAAFIVQQGTAPPRAVPTDNATVSPVRGRPGTSFAFTVTGLTPGEGVGIWIYTPDGGRVCTVCADGSRVRADSRGVASWSLTSSTSLRDGVYAMVSRGTSSTQVRVVRFEVRRVTSEAEPV
jgi:hypothetical protein